MIIHVISTVNGEENEGMRNVATHISNELKEYNSVILSSLHDLLKIPGRSLKADCTLIFARCLSKVYYIARLCSLFSKHTFLFIVQKPDRSFINLSTKHPLKCNCFTACIDDVKELKLAKGFKHHDLKIGINTEKFHPVSKEEQNELKKKYGFSLEKPLVIHVGHCSSGRGLEDFCNLDPQKFQRFVVASGMFDSNEVILKLRQAGVRLHSGYIQNINEIYQMADAYFFPTRNEEYVISVPLSVMEALACGVPTVAYSSFRKLQNISSVPGSIYYIDDKEELNNAFEVLINKDERSSHLLNTLSWKDVTKEVYLTITEAIR